MRNLFSRLVAEDEHTILFSSHQLSEVEQMCNSVTVVNKGETVAEGAVQDLVKNLRGEFPTKRNSIQ